MEFLVNLLEYLIVTERVLNLAAWSAIELTVLAAVGCVVTSSFTGLPLFTYKEEGVTRFIDERETD